MESYEAETTWAKDNPYAPPPKDRPWIEEVGLGEPPICFAILGGPGRAAGFQH